MKNYYESKFMLRQVENARPMAVAEIMGGEKYPDVRGEVDFYQIGNGVVVVCMLRGLPQTRTNIFAFHIHENGECDGDFTSAGGHFGAGDHPNHAGDMPVLLSNDGDAFLAFFTNRFAIDDIIGRAVIVHALPDDFVTQPSGNSGERIACGIIKRQ